MFPLPTSVIVWYSDNINSYSLNFLLLIFFTPSIAQLHTEFFSFFRAPYSKICAKANALTKKGQLDSAFKSLLDLPQTSLSRLFLHFLMTSMCHWPQSCLLQASSVFARVSPSDPIQPKCAKYCIRC